MGDVGKYALKHALKSPGVAVKAIAMTSGAAAEPNFDIEVDVQPEALQLELKDALEGVETTKIVIEEKNAQRQLEQQFNDVEAVIACVGSRQSGALWQWKTGEKALMNRWCSTGAQLVADAMAVKNVKRLVLLSSFGVGDDFVPWGFAKVLHATQLLYLNQCV